MGKLKNAERRIRIPARYSFESTSAGIDPSLQLYGGDPYGTQNYFGLQVPRNPTTSPQGRYLFILAVARFASGNSRVRLRGLGQYLSMGALLDPVEGQASYVLEREIQSPGWRFPDGNVSWHVTRVSPGLVAPPVPTTAVTGVAPSSTSFRYANSPALIYETISSDVTAYTAPYGGQPLGDPLCADLGCFHDLRWGWRRDTAWRSLDVPVQTPCDVVFWASVYQAGGAPVLPSFTAGAPGVPDEDNFYKSFPGARYWRVAGRMVFDQRMR